MSRPHLAVIIPAYNEEVRILPTLERIREYLSVQDYSWTVMVVSDGSKDKTHEIVGKFAAENPGFTLNISEVNRGKGYVVRKGMLEAEADFLLFSDADLATPIEEVEKLMPKMQDHDIAIGSRPLRDSKLEVRQPFYREWLGRVANKMIQSIGLKGIQDTQCGFKLFKAEAGKDVFSRCKFNGFSFDFESLMIAKDLGYKIAEVPIRWYHMEGSKVVLWRDIPKNFRDLVRLKMMGKKRRLEKGSL